jgi:hypothetical protein
MNERERLASFYAELTDEELIQVGSQYESLTEDAKLLLREEFDKRSLDAPELEEPPESFQLQELATIRKFRDLAEAMAAKSVLESAGIASLLRDENTVRMHWMWSNLLGGIRLQVRPEDVEDANRLLSQPVLETIELGEGEKYQQPRCPHCQSLDISLAPLLVMPRGQMVVLQLRGGMGRRDRGLSNPNLSCLT